MDYYMIFFFFYDFFSFFFKIVFVDLIFFILNWLKILHGRFFFKTLWIVTIFPHIVFVLLQFSSHVFFQNYLYWFFFNIELIENLALTFSTCFFFFFFQNCLFFSFFYVFFSELFLLILFFLIWSWLNLAS